MKMNDGRWELVGKGGARWETRSLFHGKHPQFAAGELSTHPPALWFRCGSSSDPWDTKPVGEQGASRRLTYPRTTAHHRAHPRGTSRSSKLSDRQPIPQSTRFSSPSRQPPSARVRARRQTAPKIDVSDGGRAANPPILVSDLASSTAHRFSSRLSLPKKVRLKSLLADGLRRTWLVCLHDLGADERGKSRSELDGLLRPPDATCARSCRLRDLSQFGGSWRGHDLQAYASSRCRSRATTVRSARSFLSRTSGISST